MLITIQQFTLPCDNLADGDYTLRCWYNQGFLDSSGQAVSPGTSTAGTQLRSDATIAGGFITFDPFTVYSTLDAQAPQPQSIQINCQLFKNNTALPVYPFQQSGTPSSWIVPDDLGATISFEEWTLRNQAIQLYYFQPNWYSAAQVDALIAANNTQVAFNQDYVITEFASLALAVAAAAVTDGTLVINESTACPDDLTVPANVTLRVTRKGSIVMTSLKTLDIFGPIEADWVQIFFNALSGQGTVQFNNAPVTPVPQWWGAYNDNTHATTTTAAIRAMFESGAHNYFFPAGTYLNSDYVAIVNSCVVSGEGESSIIYNPNIANTGVESVSSGVLAVVGTMGSPVTGVTIRDLYVKGGYTSGAANNTHGIFINSFSSRVTVQNCRVTNTSYSGINAFGDYSFITNNFVDTVAIDGIEVAKSYSDVIGNTITNAAQDPAFPQAAIEVVAGAADIAQINVIGNIIQHTQIGILIGGASSVLSITVANNNIDDYSLYGINPGAAGVQDATITGNTITNGTGTNPFGQAIILGFITDFVCNNNTLDTGLYIGIEIPTGTSTAEGLIQNNKIRNFLFGISYANTHGNLRIEGNGVKGNTTPISNSGTMTDVYIQNNTGFNPVGPLTFAGGDPAVPASGVGNGIQNTKGYPVAITLVAGVGGVAAIELGSTSAQFDNQGIALTVGQTATVVLGPYMYIRPTYTALTWHWNGL